EPRRVARIFDAHFRAAAREMRRSAKGEGRRRYVKIMCKSGERRRRSSSVVTRSMTGARLALAPFHEIREVFFPGGAPSRSSGSSIPGPRFAVMHLADGVVTPLETGRCRGRGLLFARDKDARPHDSTEEGMMRDTTCSSHPSFFSEDVERLKKSLEP